MTAFVARQIRRLIALAALLLMLVGAPWALYKLGMPLLPDHLPNLTEIWHGLTERDTGQVFLGFLVIVGAVAWAMFAILVIADVASRIFRRSAWHLPGLNVPQAAVGALVGMLIAGTIATSAAPAAAVGFPLLPHVTPVAAVSVSTVHAYAAPAGHAADTTMPPRAAAPARAAQPGAPAGPTWTVSKGDTLWSIAARTLGDPLRYPAIAALNKGRVQVDGRTFDAENFMLPGWILQLPADAHLPASAGTSRPAADASTGSLSVVVKPGDTLSQIALDTLGDAKRYPDLAAANHIADPNLIHPGQTIVIPARDGAAVGGVPQAPPAAAKPPAPSGESPTSPPPQAGAESTGDDAGAGSGRPQPPGPQTPQAGGPQQPAAAAPTAQERAATTAANPVPPAAPTATAPATATPASTTPAPTSATPARDGERSARAAWMLGGLTALGAAIAWAGLLTARRRLSLTRRPGQRPATPTAADAETERALRRRAGRIDPNRINTALRAVTAAAARVAPGGFALVLIGEASIELRPASPAPPPEGFGGTPAAWILPLPEALPADAFGNGPLAAIPALTTIGTLADGTIVAIDLEHVGAVQITGDPDAGRELLNHITVELTQKTWCDGIHLTRHPAPDDLDALDFDCITPAPDLQAAVRALTAHTETIRHELGGETVLQGRTHGDVTGVWEPHLLAADAAALVDVPGIDALVDGLESGPPAATALIAMGGDLGIDLDIHVGADRAATVPRLFGDTVIHAAGLTDVDLAAMISLFTHQHLTGDDDGAAGHRSEPDVAPAAVPVGPRVDEPAGTRAGGSGRLRVDDDATTRIFREIAAAYDDPDADTADPPGANPLDGAHTPELPAETTPTRDDLDAKPSPAGIRPATSADRAPQAAGRPGAHDGESNVARRTDCREPAADGTLDADLAEWRAQQPRRPKIAILGPATVQALGPMPDRQPDRLRVFAVYLALHTGGVTLDKFATDLWPEGHQSGEAARRGDMSRLRSWLGTPPGSAEPFLRAVGGIYTLTDRLLDSELFTRLVKRADRHVAGGEKAAALTDLRTALDLVRGPILPEAVQPDYAWLANPDRMEDRVLPMRVTDAAHITVDLSLAAGDAHGAADAAEIGRLVDPNSTVPLCDLLRIAENRGDTEVALKWAELILRINEAAYPEYLDEPARTIVLGLFRRVRPEPRVRRPSA